ncbi:hypothetical protein ACFFHT_08995 [Gallibacterium melopsittaci]|uniref:DUF3742 domain-containing protein n=1 Tax=Gallibacterium melopsittaci TaxID=516063 RepID=A0ABV6HYH6_9PAST|nr:hypothetical protein [Gallibacterium salpingitidis]WKS98642.1 V-type ATPase subunit a family protein [Gallibacterium salpingitidis]
MTDTNNLGYRFGTYLKKLRLEKKASQPVLYYAQLAIIGAAVFSIIAFGVMFGVLLFALYIVLNFLKKGTSEDEVLSDAFSTQENDNSENSYHGAGLYEHGWGEYWGKVKDDN